MSEPMRAGREQFEAWAIKRHGWNKAHAQSRLLRTPNDARYSDVLTQQKWEAYQAGRESMREEAANEAEWGNNDSIAAKIRALPLAPGKESE